MPWESAGNLEANKLHWTLSHRGGAVLCPHGDKTQICLPLIAVFLPVSCVLPNGFVECFTHHHSVPHKMWNATQDTRKYDSGPMLTEFLVLTSVPITEGVA